MTTLSIIKADTGGFVGHCEVHPDMIRMARSMVDDAVSTGLLIDGKVARCGDDISLIMTHTHGPDAKAVHSLAGETFLRTNEVAKRLGLCAAGQDPRSHSYGGSLRGTGPGYAELELVERPSEPVICFLADKTHPGAWNLPLYKMFADPFNTPGLVIDERMRAGFRFEVYDLHQERRIIFEAPREIYDMLMLIGAPARYVIHRVESVELGIPAASTSTQRLPLITGKDVGKDDPVMIVRCQAGLPAVGEVLEPFAFPHTVAGCLRGAHHAPVMPVGLDQATPARFDGPPRVVALGFQITSGKLVGARDLFADPSFDRARSTANEVMDYLRRHGPFEPHRLPLEDLGYTATGSLEARMAGRWMPLPGQPLVPAAR